MQINLSGHHVEITPALRGYVDEKLERIKRHFEQTINVRVVLGVEKLRQKAEAEVHVAGGDIYAEAEDEDMYAAIDALIDKLDRQIRKHKEKLKDHHQAEGRTKAQV